MDKRTSFKNLLPPVIISFFLVGMFLSFLHNIDKRLSSVNEDINNDRAIVLDSDCNEKKLSEIIFNDGYAETKKDADFIASVLINRQNGNRFPSLYTLQKRAFGQVPIKLADSCGVLLSKQQASYDKLGQNDEVFLFSKDSVQAGKGKLTVTVFKKVESSKWWKKKLKKEDKMLCEGVPVRLTTHFRDSLNQACSAIVGFVVTDSKGVAVFDGLDTETSYSVLPIKRGCEYGTSKGTIGGKWRIDKSNADLSFYFEEKEHRIPLFGNATLRQIKTDKTILVRSPQEYKAIVVKWFIYVMIAWWVLCFYMVLRKKKFSGALFASCMFLTGLCLLMMFSMQDPLNDELHGVSMGIGVVIGLVACIFFQEVDFVKFYQNNSKVGFDIPLNVFRWFFKPYRQKVFGLATTLKSDVGFVRKMIDMVLVLLTLPFWILDLLQITRLSKAVDKFCEKLPKGTGWLVTALLLTGLLFVPGLYQEIGGMKVNLNIFGLVFQPSEIAKYLILFFIAAFFTQQADTIIAYSLPNRIKMIGCKVKTLFWIILGLAVLMGMYLRLGDMGPGLVLGITFILLYSVIKSKVNLEHLDEEGRWKRIFSCDFAMLIYGVLTFIGFLLIGYKLGGKEISLLFGVLWFVFWIALGYIGFKKQLFESALLMNAVVFLFIFGGHIMSYVPALKDSSTVERFEARTRMCINTWGDLDIEHLGKNAEPVSNTQVANGLWALATGGMRGQGWGEGKPSLVPAFHTDMILSSIGEQLGWIGLLMVVIALAVLLRKMAVIGYQVGHPFAFYLCLGFSIVIGVQFFIIALGSSGIIPLTGVTVPFLSFGRVSMILNLAAFGIVLSFCNSIKDETVVSTSVRQKSVEQYSYPIAMVTMVFLFFAVSTLLVWQYYQLWKRNSTLIRPAYVINNQGAPVVEYNPRIGLLVRNMYAGRIYDRKGILLATSDKSEITPEIYTSLGIDQKELDNMLKRNQRRYYPMGEHMFFMVGDQNEGLMFAYDENHPVGYMAEAQHLSYLRGFDNVMYDKTGKPIKVELKTDRLKESAYLAPKDTVSDPILLRNYEPLLKYLKDGIDGKKVEQHNKKVKEEMYDLHLTVDAALQIDLQNSIKDYVANNYNNRFLRISAVVLDAQNGDLLASSNYPLPDYNRLREEEEIARHSERGFAVYSDNMKEKDWKAYTDRDLGTTYQTPPGSTAKVMSAMGGFRKLGVEAGNQRYYVTDANRIEVGIEPKDWVTMERAIEKSSNCYFVNLVNEKDLYENLKDVYTSVGICIGGIIPYIYTAKSDTLWKSQYYSKIDRNSSIAINKYKLFEKGRLVKNKSGRYLTKGETNMNIGEWRWAWGQGYSNIITKESFDFLASPLNMARVASTVVNNGSMPVTQFLLANNEYECSIRHEDDIRLINSDAADILKDYMLKEAKKHANNGHRIPPYVGSKTGTPERYIYNIAPRRYNRKLKKYVNYTEEKRNDGWYVFFVEGDAAHHSLAVAVRMERLDLGSISSHAVRLSGNVLLDCLNRHGYIRNN